MKTKQSGHWTERSVEDFQFAISLDFVDQIEAQLEVRAMKQTDLAKELKVSEGRVSQILNNPGNLTLNMIVKCATAVGMKVSVVAYEDDDHEKPRGPIHSQIFRTCWEKAGKPRDVWSLPAVQTVARTATNSVFLNCLRYKDTFSQNNPTADFWGSYWTVDSRVYDFEHASNLRVTSVGFRRLLNGTCDAGNLLV
jgi:antitoxin component HigA of HigAB toxin-antitoxin module